MGYETYYGQLMLAAFLNMKDKLNYFMGKADKLICEIPS